jgi:aldose sugar dehydrogenase
VMSKNILMVIIIIITSSGIMSFVANTEWVETSSRTKKARKIYAKYCSGCHGEKMEAFVDRKWKYGKHKDSIVRSISAGSPDFGMPSYKDAIAKKDIEAIAALMTEYIKNVDQYKVNTKPLSDLFTSENLVFSLDTIATDLLSPWGFAQLPDGNYLVSDRAGTLYKVDQHKNKTAVKNTPNVLAEGQGGLLDIELHPDYANNGWVYMSYSKFKIVDDVKMTSTAIVRGKIKENVFTEAQELFEALPYTRTKHHYGSKIVFDDKGFLYFSVGDRGMEKEFPQRTENDNGKIHRLHDDGSIPADNPFVKVGKSKASIYSYGHRNPQGLIFNKATAEVWETEHGPRGGDELNIIRKGANYGWPVISYGINYDGTPITNISKKEGMEQPEIYWIPSIAPCGMTMVNSDKYPAWKGDIMIGSLRFKYLNRCVMKNNKVIKQEKLLMNLGRVRNVEMGSDGYLYVAVELPGMVFRLMPK